MALTDFFRRRGTRQEIYNARSRQVAEAVNEPMRLAFFGFGSHYQHHYADAYLWTIVNIIFKGLANVRFYNTEDKEDFAVLCDFVQNNINALWWQYINDGYMIVAKGEEGYYLPDKCDVKFNNLRQVVEPDNEEWCVNYSKPYMLVGKTDMHILRDILCNIDTYKNADEYLTRTYGALGIISSKDMPMNYNDREDVLNGIKSSKGITGDKQQFILSNMPIDFKQVDLNVEQLQLSDKIDRELMVVADYFGVPFDLLSASGQSTYANQEQAIKNFYSNCVSPFCEEVLAIVRLFVRRSPLMVNSDIWTFSIDNVDGLKDERDRAIERLQQLADLNGKLSAMDGIVRSRLIDAINRQIEQL